MEWFWLAIPVAMFFAAGALLTSHLVAWRRLDSEPREPRDRDFRYRQLRRRVQSSAMIMLLALGLEAALWIKGPPWLYSTVLGLVLVLLFWVLLLAMADVVATKYHYGRIRQQYQLEQVKLQAELRRLKSLRANGHGNGQASKGLDPYPPESRDEP